MKSFIEAKNLAECLYAFPYQAPSDVPISVRQDKELMAIIATVFQTTIGPTGGTQQTTIDAAERMRLQEEFKSRIYKLLERCLADDPAYAPAYLLYPKVAAYNTRARHRPSLIQLHERFLPAVDLIANGTRGYDLIADDIKGVHGSCYEMVERHLADFHYDLAVLYKKETQSHRAEEEYRKAIALCPKIYGRGDDKIRMP